MNSPQAFAKKLTQLLGSATTVPVSFRTTSFCTLGLSFKSCRQEHPSSLSSHPCQCHDLHHIRLGVRTAGAIDRPLSDFGKDNLHAQDTQTTSD